MRTSLLALPVVALFSVSLPGQAFAQSASPEVQKLIREMRAKGAAPERIRAAVRRKMAELEKPAPPIPTDLPKELRARVDRIIADGKKKGETREQIRARVQKLLDEVKAQEKAKPKKGRLV
jgi:hypothetical protein